MEEDPFAQLAAYLEPNNILAFKGDFGIKLHVLVPKVFVVGRTTGYRLYIEAIEPRGIESSIFVYQRFPQMYKGNTHNDKYQGVASPADMEEYPLSAPDSDGPFFRLPTVDLVFRSIDQLTKCIELISQDTAELIRARAGLEVLRDLGNVNVGNPESASSSSSSV